VQQPRGCRAYGWSFFSEALQRIVLPKRILGTDVIAEVARLKYEEHRTHREVQEALAGKGVHVAYGEVTKLLRAFDALIKGWQELNKEEIRKALKPRVWLKCGGYITFYQTEALTVVDVNTGRFVGATRLSETIFQTNLEAAEEIARQLRLRDIGGIVIVDFIDMPRVKDRAKVMEVFQKALKKDKARVRIIHISPLGLVELTRKRRSPGLSGIMQEPCPRCEGKGKVPSILATAAEIARELRIKASESEAPAFLVVAHPQVALALVGEQGRIASELERQLKRALYIRACSDMPFEEFRIEEGQPEEIESKASTLHEGESFEVDARSLLTTPSGGKVASIKGCLVDLPGLDGEQVERLLVRIKKAGKFMAEGEVLEAA